MRAGSGDGGECGDHPFRTGELHNLVIERVQGELDSVEANPLDIPGLGEDRDTEVAEAIDECAASASEEAGEEWLAPVK